jgi:hypothetical protein
VSCRRGFVAVGGRHVVVVVLVVLVLVLPPGARQARRS